MGVNAIRFNPLYLYGNAKQSLDEYVLSFDEKAEAIQKILSLKEKFRSKLYIGLHKFPLGTAEEMGLKGCLMTASFSILPNGHVIPCPYLTRHLLGNLLTQSVEEIWNPPKSKKFRNLAILKQREKCMKCPYLNLCGSYCISELWLKYGILNPSEEFFNICKEKWEKYMQKSTMILGKKEGTANG